MTRFSSKWILCHSTWYKFRRSHHSDLPLVIASTLLVPGYVDAEKVGRIAQFIAALDPRIHTHCWPLHPTSICQTCRGPRRTLRWRPKELRGAPVYLTYALPTATCSQRITEWFESPVR
jgi:pyruvate-formate lyase-activating enzyme